MKKLPIRLIGIIVFLIILNLGCTCEEKSINVEADKAAINELYSQYCKGCNTGDLELWISLWDDNAMRFEPEIPTVIGKENIKEYIQPAFENFNLEVVILGEPEIEITENWAFSQSEYTVTLTPKTEGPTTFIEGRWVDILRRQDDGSWKIYRDMANYKTPPTTETPTTEG